MFPKDQSEVYQHPKYYEIAYSFVDADHVDLLEAYIREYSGINVKTVLDIGCGPSVQLREFARRGYKPIGLDCSLPMLEYLQDKAREEQVTVETVHADMMEFRLDQPVDFCYILLGSINYVGDTQGLLSHLSCVADAMNSGGLYLIENMLVDWTKTECWRPITWEMTRDGVKVQNTYSIKLIDALEQTFHQILDLEVDEHGTRRRFTEHYNFRLFLPQELKTIVEMHGRFEFVGFFERENTNVLRKLSPDNIVLLRKR